ncbi:PREDICTED: pentatricopeptide repeat-containing protein At5g61800-like [Nelumbo nucifera]|uniref:Pentatricopeptide repeat-containing protein At5g61800-like n=1 Tax=Nelumbo nucifera TaxID=4432 RepID=A0A1U7ZPA4_NELNU|nr:PREDICTED: pentatricopeptide repeat-containing protein At5g61800-like [Nelumbo nucifera]
MVVRSEQFFRNQRTEDETVKSHPLAGDGNYAEIQETGVCKRYKVDGQDMELDGSYHVVVFSRNRTIDNLIKCGRLDSAIEIFEAMPVCDIISWNLVIAGHAHHGFPKLALDLFKEMVSQGLRESPSTCSSVLGICSDAGFYQEGLQVHCRVVLLGFNANLFVGSALIDLYLQASYLKPDSLEDEIKFGVDPNGVTFYYLIYACARHRMGREGLKMLETMIQEVLKPDVVTFLSVLMGCSHSGLVREGQLIFESMETIHVVYLDKRLVRGSKIVAKMLTS